MESKFNIFGNLKASSFQNKNEKSKIGGIFASEVILKPAKKCKKRNFKFELIFGFLLYFYVDKREFGL